MNDLNIEKFNPGVAEITKLAEEFRALTIAGVDDKAGYKAVDEARKKLKATRVQIEKDGKALRADALEWQRKIIAKEKELIGLIEPVEIELSLKQKAINDEKEKIRRKGLMPERMARLQSIGVTISEETLLFMEDEKFAAYFNSKNAEFLAEKERKLKAEKEEAERKQREEQEKIDAEKRKIEEEKVRLAYVNRPIRVEPPAWPYGEETTEGVAIANTKWIEDLEKNPSTASAVSSSPMTTEGLEEIKTMIEKQEPAGAPPELDVIKGMFSQMYGVPVIESPHVKEPTLLVPKGVTIKDVSILFCSHH